MLVSPIVHCLVSVVLERERERERERVSYLEFQCSPVSPVSQCSAGLTVLSTLLSLCGSEHLNSQHDQWRFTSRHICELFHF